MKTIKLNAPATCPPQLRAALEQLLIEALAFCERYNLTPYGRLAPQLPANLSLYLSLRDYQILQANLPETAPTAPCFWQNQTTDPAFPKPWTRLCLNGSMLEDLELEHLPIHQGISLNLIPLFPDNHGNLLKRTWIWYAYKQLELRLQKLVCLAAMTKQQERCYGRLMKRRQSLLERAGCSPASTSAFYWLFPYNVNISDRQPRLRPEQIKAWPETLDLFTEDGQPWPEFDVPEDIG
ncbi:MAG: hypothetical protein PHR21_01190 [Oscillospiraceae bacterium]|nr:hypothetical protein [Oscillospiraceae bacterium]MDD4367940.1 hypothetical protein [Oscillospiraceae bacterium]